MGKNHEESFQRVFSSAPWEAKVGYCRAVKAGNQIFVTGTAPVTEDGLVHAPDDGYQQARRCFEIIRHCLQQFDCNLSAVVRTRMFVTDISRWREYGKAHFEFFGVHPPATTMVEVRSLIDPQMLIEVEADAMVIDR